MTTPYSELRNMYQIMMQLLGFSLGWSYRENGRLQFAGLLKELGALFYHHVIRPLAVLMALMFWMCYVGSTQIHIHLCQLLSSIVMCFLSLMKWRLQVAMFSYLLVESRMVLALVVVMPIIGKMFCCISVSIVLDSGMLLLLSCRLTNIIVPWVQVRTCTGVKLFECFG